MCIRDSYTKNEAALPVGYSIKAESCEEFVKLLNDKSADYGTVKSFIDENAVSYTHLDVYKRQLSRCD